MVSPIKSAKANNKQPNKPSALYNTSKKRANDYFDYGLDQIHNAQDTIKEYSDELATRVRKNPLMSVFIAGAAGYFIASIFRRRK